MSIQDDSYRTYYRRLYDNSPSFKKVLRRIPTLFTGYQYTRQSGIIIDKPIRTLATVLDQWHHEFGKYHKGNVFKP